MRAEEGNAIWRTYYTVAFSLWTQSRREQIKEKVCFAGFVCFSTVTASEGGRGEGEERGTMRQKGRERGKEGGGRRDREKYIFLSAPTLATLPC